MTKRKKGKSDVAPPAPAVPPLTSITITSAGSSYTTPPPTRRGRAQGRPRRLPRTQVFALPDAPPQPLPTMHCYCCDQAIALARKVRLRCVDRIEQISAEADEATRLAYVEELTFRWAVVCLACYRRLDNEVGGEEIGGHTFNLAGASRGDKAAIIDAVKYQAFQQREAAKLGLSL
jgi:hypothetical protein